jgi:hypothetical protein
MRTLTASLLAFVILQASGSRVTPWVPDNGDGTYRNPVIFADYSDA